MEWFGLNGFFLIRVAYVIVCCLALGFSIHLTDSPIQVFTSLLLFYLPLGLDYWTHTPQTEFDLKRRKWGILIPAIISALLIPIIMFSQQVDWSFINSYYIKYFIFLPACYFVYLAILDLIAYSDSEEEYQYRENVKQKQREKFVGKQELLGEREQYYKKTKTKQHVSSQGKRKKRKGGRK